MIFGELTNTLSASRYEHMRRDRGGGLQSPHQVVEHPGPYQGAGPGTNMGLKKQGLWEKRLQISLQQY